MTLIRYDIIPQSGGWSIAMGGAVGPPYLELTQAVRDTEHVAALLAETGDVVDIVVWQGGEPHLLERMDSTHTRRDAHAHARFTLHSP